MDIETLVIEEFKEDKELINVARYEQVYGINADDLGKAVESLKKKGILSGGIVSKGRVGKKDTQKKVKSVNLLNASLLVQE